MDMLKIGKLYICEEFFLMLYPDKDTAAHSDPPVSVIAAPPAAVDRRAAYWTRQFGKPVSYLEKSSPILVLGIEENFVEVLGGERKGWIIYNDFVKIREIV
jgi:hypothetical protein